MAGIYAADGSQNVTVVGGSAAGASATQTQGTAANGVAAVGNPVQVGGVYEVTPPTYDNADASPLHVDLRGNLKVALFAVDGNVGPSVSSPTADGAAASTSLAVRSHDLIFNGSTWDRRKKPAVNGRLLSAAASTNATLVRTGVNDLFCIHGFNANAAARYLKIYNKATAPTVGTDTPILTLYLAPTAAFRFEFDGGFYFSLGLGYGLTTGVADADTGALTAGDILAMNLSYA